MKLHRFIGDFDLSSSHLIVSDAGLVHQWKKVLRFAIGDAVVLCDGKGFEARATIKTYRPTSVALDVEDRLPSIPEASRSITLYCSILKRENLELVAQKATEIGIKKLVPMVCARTVKHAINPVRLASIMKEAAEQSGHGSVPFLGEPLSFSECLVFVREHDENIFFHAEGSGKRAIKNGSIGIFVGPEGGWTPEEIAQAQANKFTECSLGPFTLRAETAALIATYFSINQ